MNKEEAYKKLASFNFNRILDLPIENIKHDPGTILLTGCSGLKSDLSSGLSKEIYMGNKNNRFYYFCDSNKLNYGTISDKYGVVTSDQIIENYDLAPNELTKEEKEKLKIKIEKQLTNLGVTTIYFFSPSLLQSFTYLYLLKDYPANKFLITSLKIYSNLKKRFLI